jgi:hypothetical protein
MPLCAYPLRYEVTRGVPPEFGADLRRRLVKGAGSRSRLPVPDLHTQYALDESHCQALIGSVITHAGTLRYSGSGVLLAVSSVSEACSVCG